jgi:beta-galactosidase
VPRANHRIKFRVEGPADIVSTDNGDPTNLDSFQTPERDAFNGLCLVIVRSRAAGKITVRAEADGLPPATITMSAR